MEYGTAIHTQPPEAGRVPAAARSWGALVLGLACVAAGCAHPETDRVRQRFLEDVLRERAAGLDELTRRTIARSVLLAEQRYGVDGLLLAAVMEQESHFRPRARSHKGALGLMQVRPATARAVARRHGIPYEGEEDLFDPKLSVFIGAAYLAELESSFGSWELGLAAYHRGPTKVRRTHARGRDVHSRYAREVLERQRRLERRLYGPR